MLKCICFLLTEDYLGKIDMERERTERMLGSKQIEGLFFPLEESVQKEYSTWGKAGTEVQVGEAEFVKKDTLFVTDESGTFTQFLEAGCYVVALFHAGNQEETFPGAVYAVEDLAELEADSYEKAYRRLSGRPWDILETERLLVRESTVEDVEAFYRIYSHPEITRYMENLYQEHEAEYAYMKAYIEKVYGFFGYGMWSVLWKETGQVIGRAGLSVREGYELPELGFVIDTDYQGQGCGYEVCEAILRYAREELAFTQVQALVQEGNTASLHLLEKLGFIYEKNVVEAGCEHKLFIINF